MCWPGVFDIGAMSDGYYIHGVYGNSDRDDMGRGGIASESGDNRACGVYIHTGI